jgi:ubiquinone/menaquinone biosynthesis C-methylase UbiE
MKIKRTIRNIIESRKSIKNGSLAIAPAVATKREQAEKYDEYKERFHGKRGEIMRERLVDSIGISYQTPIKVLDCGTGTGDLLIRVARRYPKSKVFGLDASDAYLRIARKKVQKQNIENRIKLIKADLRGKKLKDIDVMDVVISQYVFHYEFDRLSLFKSIYEALKDDGILVFGIVSPLIDEILNQKWWVETENHSYLWHRQHGRSEKVAKKQSKLDRQILERYTDKHVIETPVDKWLQDIRKASFRNPECVWRDYMDVIFRAIK